MTATTKDFCDDHAGTPVDAADSGIEEGGFDREAALVVVRRLFALLQGDILGLDDLLLQIVASQTDDPEVHKLAAMSERVRMWRYAPPKENSFDRDIRLAMLQDAQDDMSAAGERVVALLPHGRTVLVSCFGSLRADRFSLFVPLRSRASTPRLSDGVRSY